MTMRVVMTMTMNDDYDDDNDDEFCWEMDQLNCDIL